MEDPGIVNYGGEDTANNSYIKVVGVGGGGGNAVNNMYNVGIKGVDYVICNSDNGALNASPIKNRVLLGPELCKGLGCGAVAEKGKKAAEESIDDIKKAICTHEAKMAFITAGMGKGTGTGSAPVIAGAVKEEGLLTVGIVTIPFHWEGRKKILNALKGVEEMEKNTDALLVINNERLYDVYPGLPISDAYKEADNVLLNSAKGIAEIITLTGYQNVDFEDVNTVMRDSGVALMGTGFGKGENRLSEALNNAITSPLLKDNDIKGAKRLLVVLYSRRGQGEISTQEMSQLNDFVDENDQYDADVSISGLYFDDDLEEGQVKVTIIATGFKVSNLKLTDNMEVAQPKPAPSSMDATGQRTLDLQEKETTPASEPVAQPIDKAKDDAERKAEERYKEFYGNTGIEVKKTQEENNAKLSNVNDKDTLEELENKPAYSRRENITVQKWKPIK